MSNFFCETENPANEVHFKIPFTNKDVAQYILIGNVLVEKY